MVESYGRIDMFFFLVEDSGGGKFCFQGNWFIMIKTEEPPVEPDHDRLSAYTPLIAPEAPDIEELQGEEPLERGYVEAPREGSFEKSEGSSSSVLDVDVSAKRDLGEKTLNVEAMSKGRPPPYSHAQEPLL